MSSNSLRKSANPGKPAIAMTATGKQQPIPQVEDVQFSAEYNIPTLNEIAEFRPTPTRPAPTQHRPQNYNNNQVVNAGTIILSPELLRQITDEVKKEVMRDVRQALRTSLSRAVCQTVGIATKDMRARLQKQLEESLPEMIEETVFKRRTKR